MNLNPILKILLISFIPIMILSSCNGKLPGADAQKYPPDPNERVKKNLEEGKGFRLSTAMKGRGDGNFEFASSNELWRASLDVLDFIPLVSANYSGGIIITDWYSEKNSESIKITVRFLTNEIRSDAIAIKVFYKKCSSSIECEITEEKGDLQKELLKEILKKATIYKQQEKDKNFQPYSVTDLKN